MKIWAVCDATTGYVLRLAIYEGKVGDEVERELGKKVVLGLVENYFNSGRVVTTDNFFTSKALGVELMKRNMGLLGTLNKNRMDVIPEFAEGKGKELQSSMFAFQKDFTMVTCLSLCSSACVNSNSKLKQLFVRCRMCNGGTKAWSCSPLSTTLQKSIRK